MKLTWGIIGLGWLGESLAESVRADGDEAWGTHRSSFDFERDELPRDHCDILFLNTPPLTRMAPPDYVAKVHASGRVFFVSSTSVYGEVSGRVTEETAPQPATESGKWLLETETALRKKFGDRLTVIRPGGLIGGQRHPVKILSARGTAGGAGLPVNLIHRSDVVGIVRALARSGPLATVNAVAPHHPAKDVYYNEWAAKLGLPSIAFEPSKEPAREIESLHLARIYPKWICPHLDSF